MESEVRGMSIEATLPIDLLMDACILTAVQLALGRLHARRLLRALLALCLYSILSALLGNRFRWLRSWPGLTAACLIAAALLISVSTVFLKQHSVLDVLAALPLCAAAYLLVYARKQVTTAA